MKSSLSLLFLATAWGLQLSPAMAAEGAISVYAPGFFSSMAGMMPDPGTYGEFRLYVYGGEVEDAFLENQVVFNVQSDMVVPMFSFTHVTSRTLFGGQLGWGFVANYGDVDVTARVNVFDIPFEESDSANGVGDLSVSPVILGWHNGNWHAMGFVDVYVPTGRWDIDDLATTGLNRWAVEPMFNATYFNETNGRELSLALGYTVNFENSETHYDSGDEFHVDYTLAQWLPKGWMVGAAGFWFKQVTPDKGAPEILGGNNGEVLGLGPIVSYTRALGGGTELLVSARYYTEFGAENRLEGDSFWLSASFNF